MCAHTYARTAICTHTHTLFYVPIHHLYESVQHTLGKICSESSRERLPTPPKKPGLPSYSSSPVNAPIACCNSEIHLFSSSTVKHCNVIVFRSPVRLLVSNKSITVSGSRISVEKELGVTAVDGVENEEVFRPLLLLPPPPPPPVPLEIVAAMGNRRDSTMQSAVKTMVSFGGL